MYGLMLCVGQLWLVKLTENYNDNIYSKVAVAIQNSGDWLNLNWTENYATPI